MQNMSKDTQAPESNTNIWWICNLKPRFNCDLQSMRLSTAVSLLYYVAGFRGWGRQKQGDAFIIWNWNWSLFHWKGPENILYQGVQKHTRIVSVLNGSFGMP